jgi:teichuronic acid biosynthesis glycosyltransferase TuaH
MTASETTEKTRVLVLGTADWNQAIATNQHYVVRELCKDLSLDVTFVESTGLRRPELHWRDIRRMGRRLRRAILASEETPWRETPRLLKVISPLVIPRHSGFFVPLNRWLLQRQLRDWVRSGQRRLLWTYTPLTYGLECEADAVIYHCVDLLGEVTGIDNSQVADGERTLANFGATAVGTSQVVSSHLTDTGFNSVLCWENVADIEVVEAAHPLATVRPGNRVIFAGNLSPLKVDFELLKDLSRAGLDVVVAGPRAEGGGNDEAEFRGLMSAGVTYLGMLRLDELASELAASTIGLIPYLINSYTRGVSPLKTYEYLAAGLCVVSSDLPGVAADNEHIWKAASRAEFVSCVLELAGPPSKEAMEIRMQLATNHSWRARGEDVRQLVRRHVSHD